MYLLISETLSKKTDIFSENELCAKGLEKSHLETVGHIYPVIQTEGDQYRLTEDFTEDKTDDWVNITMEEDKKSGAGVQNIYS